MNIKIYLLFLIIVMFSSCKNEKNTSSEADNISQDISGITITKEPFGSTPDGPVNLFTLKNKNGIEISITNFGGIITSIITPDNKGNKGDIALGFDNIEQYLEGTPYFGAIIGRYGNRIGKGKFSIDTLDYVLETNDGSNHLHGGESGFDKKVWNGSIGENNGLPVLNLTYLSKDMEGGYPGDLSVVVSYSLDNDNRLLMTYSATCNKSTPVNLTNHTYFNLAGGGDILDHKLMIDASKYTPVDEGLIPTGEIAEVTGTPFDFTQATAIGVRINDDNQQLQYGKGYDHNWVLDDPGLDHLSAVLFHPESGRKVEVYTTEPGLQFYSGNFLDGSITGKNGITYPYRGGLCLETQHFPDSPNKENFPITILKRGETYFTQTIYKFTTE